MKKGSKKYTDKEKAIRLERFNEWAKDYKKRNGIKTDKDLIRILNFGCPSYISAMKSGERAIPNSLIKSISSLDKTYSVEYLMGKSNQRNIYEKDNSEIKAQIMKSLFLLNGHDVDIEYLVNVFNDKCKDPYQLEINKTYNLIEKIFKCCLDI